MKIPSVSPCNALALRVIAIMALCGVATFLLGKDSNWDIFNYHLYIAHAFWTNQDLRSDFMAASLPRYFNPIGYLPFYWMIQAGWHSLIIGLLLAAFHSFALIMLWELCVRFLFKNDSRPKLNAALALGLAAMSPVFLGTLGGSYLDSSTLVFVFGGLLLLCFELERPSSTFYLPLLAGCFFGIAAALKLTNMIYVASAGISILVVTRFKATGLKTIVWYGVGAIVGGALAGGWWSIQLYREFGNPFFPVFNDFFHSPDFAQVRLSHERFKPASVVDALTFPFDMASSRKWVYVENAAADIRFALLVVFAVSLLVIRLLRARRSAILEVRVRNIPVEMIIAFFVVSIPVWLATSGNGRYALAIILLVAPILMLAVRAIIPDRKWFYPLLLAILAMQGVVISLGENPRWDTGAWTSKWIEVEVPPKLKEIPHGYLSVGVNSNSFIALHVHPESRLVSLLGAYPLSPDGRAGQRVNSFISAHAGRLRTLGSLKATVYRELLEKNQLSEYLKDIDGRFAMWDLRTDSSDCLPIKFSVSPNENAILISCALVRGNPQRDEILPIWQRTTRVFDRIENACPTLFSPSGGYTTRRGQIWYRFYINTDIMLNVRNNRVSYSRYAFGPFDVDMGTLEDWEIGATGWTCRKLPPHWKLPAAL